MLLSDTIRVRKSRLSTQRRFRIAF